MKLILILLIVGGAAATGLAQEEDVESDGEELEFPVPSEGFIPYEEADDEPYSSEEEPPPRSTYSRGNGPSSWRPNIGKRPGSDSPSPTIRFQLVDPNKTHRYGGSRRNSSF